MLWVKKGLIFCPDGRISWAQKYAFPPTPFFINNHILRVYVAFCDENTVGRIGFVDVDPANPSRIRKISEKPVLDIGTIGAFDENGVIPLSIVKFENKIFLYYVGYQLGFKVRYYQFQGLAFSKDGGNSFKRVSKVPILDRSDKELLNRTSAFVMYEENKFNMWYVAGSEWVEVKGKCLPVYNLRYLESEDGIKWGKEGKVCLDFKNDDELAFGRPYIIRDQGIYKMIYSIRKKSVGYRLGYATSKNGIIWERNDDEMGV